MTEDFDRNVSSRATGLIGKNSDASSIQALHQATQPLKTESVGFSGSDGPETDSNTKQLPREQNILKGGTTSASYSLDDISITPPAAINPREKPPFRLAESLAHQYFPTVQRYFPVIDEASFMHKLLSAYDATSHPASLGAKWPVIMNLVFAISAKYSEATQTDPSISPGKHLEYSTRARMCELSESSLFDYADLQQAQVEGLTAFYFLVSGQIHRYDSNFISVLGNGLCFATNIG